MPTYTSRLASIGCLQAHWRKYAEKRQLMSYHTNSTGMWHVTMSTYNCEGWEEYYLKDMAGSTAARVNSQRPCDPPRNPSYAPPMPLLRPSVAYQHGCVDVALARRDVHKVRHNVVAAHRGANSGDIVLQGWRMYGSKGRRALSER